MVSLDVIHRTIKAEKSFEVLYDAFLYNRSYPTRVFGSKRHHDTTRHAEKRNDVCAFRSKSAYKSVFPASAPVFENVLERPNQPR
jgi:hypothetical protein